VRRTGRCDCSTIRMISSFSEAGYLMPRLPHPRSCFFEQTQFESLLGDNFFQLQGLALEVFDLAGGCRSGRVTGQTSFAGFQELLRPTVIQALGNTFPATELSDGDFAAQTVEDDADLLLGRILLAGRPPDVADKALGRCLTGVDVGQLDISRLRILTEGFALRLQFGQLSNNDCNKGKEFWENSAIGGNT